MERVCSRYVGRLAVWTFVAAILAAAGAVVVHGDDQEEYNRVVAQLRKELATPFTDPNDPGLHQRRLRLRTLFASVPGSHAKELFDRLGVRPTNDALSKEFHYRLATATRQELLDILAKIPAPAATTGPASAPPPPPKVAIWPTSPLPPSEQHRFDPAIQKLERDVNAGSDPRNWRYQCWFSRLKAAGADDRVIEWPRICPTGIPAPHLIIGECDITQGRPLKQADLYARIKTAADVPVAGVDIGMITHLKADIVMSHEMTSMQMENLRSTHDNVVAAVEKLEKWSDIGLGGSSAMPTSYRAIKAWVRTQQDNPKSVYSCK